MAFDGIYRPLPERCEIEASELADAGWNDASVVLYEAEARIRELEAEVVILRARVNMEAEGQAVASQQAAVNFDRAAEAEAENARLREEYKRIHEQQAMDKGVIL